jgi:hypothetical protein
MGKREKKLNCVILFLLSVVNLLETGEFTEILEIPKIENKPETKTNIFFQPKILTEQERLKSLLDEYDNQIIKFNQNLQKVKTVGVGQFEIILNKTCLLDLKKTDDKKKKSIYKEECTRGGLIAYNYVFSSIHFTLKTLVRKSSSVSFKSSEINGIIQKTFKSCYFEDSTTFASLNKNNFNRISILQLCFRNSLDFYTRKLQETIKYKMNQLQMKTPDLKNLETELIDLNLF